jgi:hypothetical protein
MYADQLISAEKLPEVFHMDRREPRYQLSLEDFLLPLGGKLSGDNRWIKLANSSPGTTWKMTTRRSSARALVRPPSHSEWRSAL